MIDAWTFEQAIKETTENGVSWFSTKVSFSEDSWYQELRWNGYDDKIVRYDGDSMYTKLQWSPESDPGYQITQSVDLQNGFWDIEIVSAYSGWTWKQALGLWGGAWSQEFWSNDVLIWKDNWRMWDGCDWYP